MSVSYITLSPAVNVTTPVTSSPFIGRANATIPDWTLAISGISSSLSIIGAVVIFVSFVKLPEIRNFTRLLLTYLTVADLLSAIGYLVGLARYAAIIRHVTSPPHRDSLCVVQSFSIIFSYLASYLWTIVIAAHIFISYITGSDVTSRRKLHIVYHILCWGAPVTVAITAASCQVLGEDNSIAPTPWCFLRADLGHETMIYWHYEACITWELATYLVTTILYLSLKFKMYLRYRRSRRFRLDETTEGLRLEDRNYVCVWLVLYVIKIWGTVRVFIITNNPEIAESHSDVMFVLLNFQCLFTSAQAFANFILFCLFDGVVRRRLFRCVNNDREMEPLLPKI